MNFDKKKIFNSIAIIIIAVLTVIIVVEATRTPQVKNNVKSKTITEFGISKNMNTENNENNETEYFLIEETNFEPKVEQPTEKKEEEVEILKNEIRREVIENEIDEEEELQSTKIVETGEIIEVLHTVKEPKKQEIKKYRAELNYLINRRKERNTNNTFVYFNNITINGPNMKPIETRTLIDKGLILVFWSSRTEEGYEELKKFTEIENIEGINLKFVNIGSNIEFPRDVEEFIVAQELDFETLYDDMHSIPSTFSFSDPFKVVFVNKDGYLVEMSDSYNPKTFQENVDELLDFYSEYEEQLKEAEILLRKIDRSRQ